VKLKYLTIPTIALSALIASCGERNNDHGHSHASGEAHGHPHPEETHGHPHQEETHGHTQPDAQASGHDEALLGKFNIGELEIQAIQGHGIVKAGLESHLIIKLPYKDDGTTRVRAWLGTEDRTQSSVGKGDYTASNNEYNIHAMAPSPLPAEVKWWVEIEKPDGTKATGSIAPKM
jgi:hypothetical protein